MPRRLRVFAVSCLAVHQEASAFPAGCAGAGPSAYLYLSFADYYEEEGLSGYANYFEIQAQEERDHAMIFRNYLHENGEAVKLLAIDMPDKTFANFLEPLEAAMEHEK